MSRSSSLEDAGPPSIASGDSRIDLSGVTGQDGSLLVRHPRVVFTREITYEGAERDRARWVTAPKARMTSTSGRIRGRITIMMTTALRAGQMNCDAEARLVRLRRAQCDEVEAGRVDLNTGTASFSHSSDDPSGFLDGTRP